MSENFDAVKVKLGEIKKSIQEKWKEFREKFEGVRDEMAQEVMSSDSPEDLIAAGKRIQARGEALKMEADGIKVERQEEDEKMDSDRDEAIGMNEVFDAERAAKDASEQEARIVEENKLRAQAETAQIAEVRKKFNESNAENAGAGAAVVEIPEASAGAKEEIRNAAEDAIEPVQELPEEVQDIIDTMKKKGYYENELPDLKPGEAPSRDLTNRMIASIFGSSTNFDLGSAKVLMENLPYDPEYVKENVVKRIKENAHVDERDLKMMEVAGIDPMSLHDDAVKSLNRLLYLGVGDRGEIRTPENIKKWKETFGISNREFADALYEYWKNNQNSISNEQLKRFGFVKVVDGEPKWAWDEDAQAEDEKKEALEESGIDVVALNNRIVNMSSEKERREAIENLSQEEISAVAKNIAGLKGSRMIDILRNFNNKQELVSHPEVVAAFKKNLAAGMHIYEINRVQNLPGIPKEIFDDPSVQEAMQTSLKSFIKNLDAREFPFVRDDIDKIVEGAKMSSSDLRNIAEEIKGSGEKYRIFSEHFGATDLYPELRQ
jgi:hypothetical protein